MVEELYPHVLTVNLSGNKANGRAPPRNEKANNRANHQKEHRNRDDLRNIGVLVLCDRERNAGGEEKNEQDTTSHPPRAQPSPTLVANWNVQRCKSR